MITITLINSDEQETEEIFSAISPHDELLIKGRGNDNYDAISLVRKHKPDIVLIADTLIYNDGMEISKTLKRYSPASAIVIFSSCVKDIIVRGMVFGNFTGCIIKDMDMARLAKILKNIHRGEHYINTKITARAFQILADYYKGRIAGNFLGADFKNEERNGLVSADFSNSELDVLRLITKGQNNKEIAKSLYLKDGTVRNYISSIIQKAGVKNRTQVVLYAQQCGLEKRGRSIYSKKLNLAREQK